MEIRELREKILALQAVIRDRVVAACEESSVTELAEIVGDDEGDTIFAIDRVSEELLVEFIETEIASRVPVILIAEGIAGGRVNLPRGTSDADARWIIVVDPIDGTRGLMYQKRSAWILTGVAPNNGAAASLADVELAVQTEIPLVRQHLSDVLSAIRGEGIETTRFNRLTGESRVVRLQPSRAASIEQGFATIARFFPGVRDVLAEIDEEMVRGALGKPISGKAQCFEDQYISTGGQLYEMIAGRDRFIADLRPLMKPVMDERGLDLMICCHPYDLCTWLIAAEAGVIVTGGDFAPLTDGLDNEIDVSWIAYANEQIRNQLEPHLSAALRRRGLI